MEHFLEHAVGGELESFVLDAPMYKRAISIDKSDVVTHSDDFDAPGKSIFRKFPKFHEFVFEKFKREIANSIWMFYFCKIN